MGKWYHPRSKQPSKRGSFMIIGYFKVARRHLARTKGFSMLNIAGLSVGIVAFFYIVQYVAYETSYDRFHTNSGNIYRVALERYSNGSLQAITAENFAGLRKELRENFPEVKAATGFYKTPANTGVFFRYHGKIFNELGGELNADSSFFNVFPGLLLKGDPATALHNPHSMVLSESMAKKVFGDMEPMGQHIQRPNDSGTESEYVVSGIIRDIPQNSHFHTNFVTPLEYRWGNQNEWKQDALMTYISLVDGVSLIQLSDRLERLYNSLGKLYAEVKDTKALLQPLTSIHLDSHLQGELEVNGSRELVYLASLIALVIMVIAWINYVNLETARFVTRAREVGIRRVIGSGKSDLFLQFLIEYICLLALAMLLAVILIGFSLPYFDQLTSIPVTEIRWTTGTWLATLGMLAVGSLIVGLYPVLLLSGVSTIAAVKGTLGGINRGRSVRRALIIFQFCSSLILTACVLVINNQLEFMRRADKKVDVEQVITLRNPTAYSDDEVIEKHQAYRTLENELLQNSSVKMVASSSAIPGTEIGFTYVNLLKRNVNDPYDPTHFKTLFMDYNYIPFYGLGLLAGRNFDPPRPIEDWRNPWDDEDWLTLILNESATRALGFKSPEDAIDQIVEFENFQDQYQKHRIIGVVEDYHHEAIKKKVFPMILSPNYGSFQQVYYSIRIQPGSNPVDALKDIEKSWKKVFPEKPFEYAFLDDYYNQQFKSELQTSQIFTVFAGIAIFIGCLGILGMTLFEANARLKEISIRKVLGASVTNLVALLSRENARLLTLSAVISIPLIYMISDEWLSHYPISISVSAWFFVVPLGIISVMVLCVSSLETIKAANANPVDHLKGD
jgi:putative ABC transport system permease protein